MDFKAYNYAYLKRKKVHKFVGGIQRKSTLAIIHNVRNFPDHTPFNVEFFDQSTNDSYDTDSWTIWWRDARRN